MNPWNCIHVTVFCISWNALKCDLFGHKTSKNTWKLSINMLASTVLSFRPLAPVIMTLWRHDDMTQNFANRSKQVANVWISSWNFAQWLILTIQTISKHLRPCLTDLKNFCVMSSCRHSVMMTGAKGLKLGTVDVNRFIYDIRVFWPVFWPSKSHFYDLQNTVTWLHFSWIHRDPEICNQPCISASEKDIDLKLCRAT